MTMQVTIAMVSTVMARTEQYLLWEEEGGSAATAIHDMTSQLESESDMKWLLERILSDLRLLVERYLFLSVDCEDEMNRDKGRQKEILGLANDIENSVESYFFKVGGQKEIVGRIKHSTGFVGRIIPRFFKRSHEKTRSTGSADRSLLTLLDTLQGLRHRVNEILIRENIRYEAASEILLRHDHVLLTRTNSWSERASTSYVSAADGDCVAPSEVVVVERDVQKLLSILLSNDDYSSPSSSFISICGKRGLGKTTLAKLVYKHPSLVEHFDCRAWPNVRADAPVRDILESILISLSPTRVKKEEMVQMERLQLEKQLHQAQSGRRCFIVFDDVSSIDAIEYAFPMGNRTKILITTRSLQLAGQLKGHTHHMKELNMEESWMLLKRFSQIPDDQEGTAGQMEIGREIASACGGIPLAIVEIGRILRGKNLDEWKRVLGRLQGAGDTVMNVLSLSYNDLPLHLKPCFLYLGHLLVDQVMPVEKLYLLWMAEGLIPKGANLNGRRRMDVAEDYLKKLVFKSLVIAETDNESANRKFKSCQLQGLVHDLCASYATTKENFFHVINTSHDQAETSSSVSRVAIYLNLKDRNDVSLKINEAKHLRSLLFFETNESPPAKKWPKGVDDLAVFQWMRVLNFDGVNFIVKELPNGLRKLRYLRYLSFQNCYLSVLPSFVGKLKLLETLDLRVDRACTMIISDNYVLREVTRLTHLYLPTVFETISGVRDSKLKLGTLTRLEVLENFNPSLCDVDNLLELRTLQVVTVNIPDGLSRDLNKITDFVGQNGNLRQLSLFIKNFDCSNSRRRFTTFENLWDLAPLHALHVEGHIKELPRNPNMRYSTVTEIVLDEYEFENDPMPLLGRLSNLRSLVLRNDAFVGESMVCKKSRFRELRRLELINLRFLENWVVKEGAMANLSVLVIKECRRLKMLNKSMNMPTLGELKIISMPTSFQQNIRQAVQRTEGLILTFDN